jgi:hypothetical protein
VNIDRITTTEANDLLEGRHYIGATAYLPRFCFASPNRDAVAVYSHPIAASFKLALDDPLELARLWRDDDAGFRTSQFLGATLRELKRLASDSECVFTYADPSAKNSRTGEAHNGTIYRATNFNFVSKSRVTDHWDTPDGRISAAKAYRQLSTKSREAIQAARPNWRLVEGVPKLLFVFPLQMPLTQILEKIGTKIPEARRALFSKGRGGFRIRVYEDKFPSKKCAACRRLFLARRSDAKTCSPKCRVALHRKCNA